MPDNLEQKATMMRSKALQVLPDSSIRRPERHVESSHETKRSATAPNVVVQLQLEVQTPDGVWEFSQYELQRQHWRGLREHTLTYRPRGGVGDNAIVLVQAIQTWLGEEVYHSDEVRQNRTNQETGFRIDSLEDSNNPALGALSAASLADTPAEGDTFTKGMSRNRGTVRRPNIVEQLPSRLDHPGFNVRDLAAVNAQNLEMGQTIITVAYNMTTGQYLESIAYGWRQEANDEPQLMEITYTTGGVSSLFRSAVKTWNQGGTGRRQNIRLPTPPPIAVQNWQGYKDSKKD